jgi:hypothetical protein
MKEGDIVLFHRSNNIISKGIALVTKSSWTHVGVIYSITEDTIITYEALSNGFKPVKRTVESFQDALDKRDFVILTPRYKVTNNKEILDQMKGSPYDYFGLIQVLIHVLTGRRYFKETTNKFICSEAVARYLYLASSGKIDLSKEYNKSFEIITPDDVYKSKGLK